MCEEALKWRNLRHDNVLPFLGLSSEGSEFLGKDQLPSIVTPWAENGNLIDYLKKHSPKGRVSLVSCLLNGNGDEITNSLTKCLSIARGIEYLHDHVPPIVHGDLRAVSHLRFFFCSGLTRNLIF